MTPVLRLYDYWESGNAYKVRLTHCAEEGGFHLGRFPSVQAWLDRVAAQPGHVALPEEVGQLVSWP